MNLRDYFISYNSADEAHAEAIYAALRGAGYQVHFAGTDCPPGTNVPICAGLSDAASHRLRCARC